MVGGRIRKPTARVLDSVESRQLMSSISHERRRAPANHAAAANAAAATTASRSAPVKRKGKAQNARGKQAVAKEQGLAADPLAPTPGPAEHEQEDDDDDDEQEQDMTLCECAAPCRRPGANRVGQGLTKLLRRTNRLRLPRLRHGRATHDPVRALQQLVSSSPSRPVTIAGPPVHSTTVLTRLSLAPPQLQVPL